MLEKLRKPKILAIAGASLLLLGVGGIVGRATAPVRVETRVQVKTVEVEKVRTEWRDIVITRTLYVKDSKKDVVKTQKEIVRPDGTIERESTERESSQTTEQNQQESVQTQTGTQEQSRELFQDVKTEKKIVPALEWSVAIMAGAAPRAGFMPPLGPPPFVAGVHVQKKIVGPVTIGAWVLTNPSAGVSLGFQF